MAFSVCRRAQDRAPTFRVVVDMSGSLYRGTDFTLAIYATDENGCFLNVNGTAVLSLSGADASDALDDDGVALSTITITNGVWSSTKVAIDGGSGPETGVTIDCAATGYTTGTSDSFDLSEYGVVDSLDVYALAGRLRSTFDYDGEYLWYAGDKSGSNLLRINPDDFSEYTTYDASSLFGLSTTFEGLEVDNAYIYLLDSSRNVCRVLKSDMLTKLNNSGNGRDGCVLDSSYIYTSNDLSRLFKIQISDMSLAKTVVLPNRYGTMALAISGTYIYGIQVSTKSLDRRLTSDLSLDSSLDLSAHITSGVDANDVTMSNDSEYLYISIAPDSLILKIDLSTFSYAGKYTSTTNLKYTAALGVSGGYLYAYGRQVEKVCKIKASDMSLVWAADTSAYTVSSSDGYQSKVVFHNGYAYFVYENTSGVSTLLKIAQ